MFKTFKKNYLY